ncbi:hypothetical protein [Crateriforma conspicua]|uniref:Uncharacterized protein n=1 Tax=Crateriforma conspicua TaxID=2527996 RepID=A0A5C6FYN4_9PLAN|nr:hypothetical protein [Crateriforma conspicua]TWU66468.1 hypothetical protein V7x_20340 [Crateriforma conspicua]
MGLLKNIFRGGATTATAAPPLAVANDGQPRRFDTWAIVDVMGHQRYVGKVTEQVVSGCGFVRVDIPATSDQPAWTKLIGTGSIYAITPVSKEIAVTLAQRSGVAPVQPYQLQPERKSLLVECDDKVDDDFDDEHF